MLGKISNNIDAILLTATFFCWIELGSNPKAEIDGNTLE